MTTRNKPDRNTRQAVADHDMRVQIVVRELNQCPDLPTELTAERVLAVLNIYDEHLTARGRPIPRPTDTPAGLSARSSTYWSGYRFGRRFVAALGVALLAALGALIVELIW